MCYDLSVIKMYYILTVFKSGLKKKYKLDIKLNLVHGQFLQIIKCHLIN